MIYENESYLRGAGIFVYDCNPEINNNTIVQNRCTSTSGIGAGLYGNAGAWYSGVNNIIYFNNAPYMPQVAGSGDLTYSCSSQYIAGTGNIMDDPSFIDAGNKDFNLQSESPCIDAGDPESPADPDSTRADMGALYYHQYLGITGNPASDVPGEFALYPAYPNPFNPATKLEFSLPQATRVNVKIFDISGSAVVTLVDGWRDAGIHEVTFDAINLPSGVYFARLTTGDFQRTQKLLLTK